MPNDEGRLVPDFDHLVLRVDLAEPWLADVGFGEGFWLPLRLNTGSAQAQGEYGFRILEGASERAVQRRNSHADWRD